MKKFAKILAVTMCAVLLVTASIAGTLAYLTSTKAVANTFTAGKVTIEFNEVKTDLYGKALTGEDAGRTITSNYKLVPGLTYTKDATIKVLSGSEKCYLFVKLDANLKNIDSDVALATGWIKLNGTDDVYYYNDIVNALENDVSVLALESFTVDTNKDYNSLNSITTVQLIAYAVQADGFADVSAAWANTFGLSANP